MAKSQHDKPVKKFLSSQGEEIFGFYEGKTEGGIVPKIGKIIGLKECKDQEEENPSGKSEINKYMVDFLALNLQKKKPINCVLLYDLDLHDSNIPKNLDIEQKEIEIVNRICQSIQDTWKKAFRERDIAVEQSLTFEAHPDYSNLYTLSIPTLKFNLALHIANMRWSQEFIKSTIDDYILELALRPNTVSKFAQKLKIVAGDLTKEITETFPELMKTYGIHLSEAKDYIRLYAAVLKLHTSPAVFASKVMGNADEEDIREVFGALIAAFEFVGGE